jgi:hypothetical protein
LRQRVFKRQPHDRSVWVSLTALREEALAIAGKDLLSALAGMRDVSSLSEAFYRELNKLDLAALCLSGGGIRSAAFSLGVIQALAAHPKSANGAPVQRAEDSLLAQFHYLSTVSGGGYIGSWLSAWCAREQDFDKVWRNLTGRPRAFDIEPAPIAWLRSYSSYLTPRIRLLSADSWALIAIYVRNLVLNWVVIVPFLCALLLGIKLVVVALAGLLQIDRLVKPFNLFWLSFSCLPPLVVPLAFGCLGLLCLVYALMFTVRNRPARVLNESTVSIHKQAERGELEFFRGRLVPLLLSAIFLTQFLCSDVTGRQLELHKKGIDARHLLLADLAGYPIEGGTGWCSGTAFTDPVADRDDPTVWLVPVITMRDLAFFCALAGAAIYAVGWVGGAGWKRSSAVDFICWLLSGAVFGALLGIGFHFFLQIPETPTGPEGSIIIIILNRTFLKIA